MFVMYYYLDNTQLRCALSTSYTALTFRGRSWILKQIKHNKEGELKIRKMKLFFCSINIINLSTVSLFGSPFNKQTRNRQTINLYSIILSIMNFLTPIKVHQTELKLLEFQVIRQKDRNQTKKINTPNSKLSLIHIKL